ncbi:alkaline phosphatase family protein [Paracrocinitomix mangrovi]|uniref:alkaline phosphatase family protein n=1 Tax=Paracrocinitomix mangrovi TaxID=2862509 RepID=UPI001C8D4A13|nr:alkaline phosphatase family protein [Paracrocinitomix mangrovi]UKN03539.1 alkaline phosphatase family protein [Paracrocinitomix mangrovi]
MIRGLSKGIFLLTFIWVATFSLAQEKPTYKTKNVIVVIMDGPRYTETWGDSTHQHIPHLANDMVQHGVLYTNFRNNGPTYTVAGHTAICTGNYQKIKNNGYELPKKPSMFQYWLKETGKKNNKAFVITSKDKLAVLTNCKDRDWRDKFRPNQDCGNNGLFTGYRIDYKTADKVIEIFGRDKPELALINFQQPDSWGHANNWEKYLAGMKKTDEYIYRIFQYINTDPNYKDQTTLFVTNDHGRHLDGHKDGFVSHGDGCEGCRRILLYAYGPDFKRNLKLDTQREQIDIPATIAEMMGFCMPTGDGVVMEELFK